MSRPTGPDPTTVARDGAALVLTREALRWAVPVAAVLVAGMWLLRGTAAGVTALVSAGVVLLLQGLSGWATGTASRYGPQALQAATLFGVLARLGLYAVLLLLLGDVEAVDGPALATVVVTLTLVVLVAEARMALRFSRLWWTPSTPHGGTGGPHHRPDPTPSPSRALAGAEPKDRS